MLEDFLKFLKEYKIIGLAIAFVIGAAVNDLVKSTVQNLIMPVVEVFLPSGNWQEATATVGPVEFGLGSFLASLIDFLIIALLVFLFVRYVLKKEEIKKV